MQIDTIDCWHALQVTKRPLPKVEDTEDVVPARCTYNNLQIIQQLLMLTQLQVTKLPLPMIEDTEDVVPASHSYNNLQ